MTPPDQPPDGRRDRPLRLTPAPSHGPRGWRGRTLGVLPGLLVTLAMFAAAFGAGRIGGHLLRRARERDPLLDERVRFATPAPPRTSEPRPSTAVAPASPAVPGAPAPAAATVPAGGASPAAPRGTAFVVPSLVDTGGSAAARSRVRAADRAAASAIRAERAARAAAADAATAAAAPGRVGMTLVGPPLTGEQKDSVLDLKRAELAARGPRPIFPVRTDVGKELAGTRPGEATVAQRNDMARTLMADDVARTTPSPCGMSPGVERPGGGPRQTSATVCGLTGGVGIGGGASRITLGPGVVSMPLPWGGGPSAKQRARDAAVHAENLRILARIRDGKRRRTDSLSWIAESTRAARDSAARAAPKTPS